MIGKEYSEESGQNEMLANKCGLFQKTTGGLAVVAAVQTQESFAIFTLI